MLNTDWAGDSVSSPRVFSLTGLQQIQPVVNLLRNAEVLRSVPDVHILLMLLRRLELESPGAKTVPMCQVWEEINNCE